MVVSDSCGQGLLGAVSSSGLMINFEIHDRLTHAPLYLGDSGRVAFAPPAPARVVELEGGAQRIADDRAGRDAIDSRRAADQRIQFLVDDDMQAAPGCVSVAILLRLFL